jgi:hypothetical protein
MLSRLARKESFMHDRHTTTRPASTVERLEALEMMRWADDGGPCVEEKDMQVEYPDCANSSPNFVARRESVIHKAIQQLRKERQ